MRGKKEKERKQERTNHKEKQKHFTMLSLFSHSSSNRWNDKSLRTFTLTIQLVLQSTFVKMGIAAAQFCTTANVELTELAQVWFLDPNEATVQYPITYLLPKLGQQLTLCLVT